MSAVAGLAVVALSAMPTTLRWTASTAAARSGYVTEREQLLARLGDKGNENRELTAELRRLRDSVLTSLVSAQAPLRLDRRTQSDLLFDSRLPASLDNGSESLRLVALTFDGDAHDNAAVEILDTLASRRVHATMFITGRLTARRPDLVRRILAAGHVIGNHTQSHPHLTMYEQSRTQATLPGVSRATVYAELGKAERAFTDVTGISMPPIWRAPYGERNRTICAWAQEAGYLHVGWRQGRTWRENLDSNDWIVEDDDPGYRSPAEVLRKILDAAHRQPNGINGGIILMHLGTLRKHRSQQVHLALGQLIDSLSALGYSFVTVPQMAQASGVDLSLLRRPDALAGLRNWSTGSRR
jgi:peptidoglycan/xylan/chitin deacetylase (PgdA/CDA1 family)